MESQNQFNHFGNGDQINGDKIISSDHIQKQSKNGKSTWTLIINISVVIGILSGIATIFSKPMNNQFNHYGAGDQIAGNKIVNNYGALKRTILPIQDQLINELKKYPPENFSVSVANGNTEMVNLQHEFISVLQSAGWKCVSSPLITGSVVYPEGITLQAIENNNANNQVANLIKNSGLNITGQIVPEDIMRQSNLPYSRNIANPQIDLAIYIGSN